MKAEALCGLLAEEDRLAVFAAVALGAHTAGEVAAATGLPGRTVVVALNRLTQGGLIATEADRLVVRIDALRDATRVHTVDDTPDDEPLDSDPGRAAVLRTFLRDGRIEQMPAARGKRRVLLDHIVVVFEPGVRYPEKQVDALLRAWHDDYAALRRYLIDEGLMARDNGIYWRIGGPVELG